MEKSTDNRQRLFQIRNKTRELTLRLGSRADQLRYQDSAKDHSGAKD